MASIGTQSRQLGVSAHAETITVRLIHPTLGVWVLDRVTGGRVTIAAGRWPRWSAEVTAPLPPIPDQAVDPYAYANPQQLARLRIDATYGWPDGNSDRHRLADLPVRFRTANRPDNTWTIRAEGAELRADDRGLDGLVTHAAGTPLLTVVQQMMARTGLPPVKVSDSRIGGSLEPTISDAVSVDAGDGVWSFLDTLCDPDDVELFHDGAAPWEGAGGVDPVMRWRRQPALTPGAPVSHKLLTGQAGTVVVTASDYDREAFANGVAVVHTWASAAGATVKVRGVARQDTGAWRWGGPAGYKQRTFRRDWPTTKTAADRAAGILLRRTLAAGAGTQVTAPSAYWLRPGHVVQVALPAATPRLELVQAVDFDLATRRMTVDTRNPDRDE